MWSRPLFSSPIRKNASSEYGSPDFSPNEGIGISPDTVSKETIISALYVVGTYSTAYIQPSSFPEILRHSNLKALAIRFRTLHGFPRNVKLSELQNTAIYSRAN